MLAGGYGDTDIALFAGGKGVIARYHGCYKSVFEPVVTR